jgi:hypothetical protein
MQAAASRGKIGVGDFYRSHRMSAVYSKEKAHLKKRGQKKVGPGARAPSDKRNAECRA